jgi:hypothetical protein
VGEEGVTCTTRTKKGEIAMGYRSEVAFVVPASAPRFEEIEDCFDKIEERDGYRLYHAAWVKWYDDVPVVQAVNTYLNGLTDQHRFIRIGEDYDDVETWGHLQGDPFDLRWVREVVFDGKDDPEEEAGCTG